MKQIFNKVALFACLPLIISSCNTGTGKQTTAIANYPDWAKNAVIYEVNVRQYTPEGTFKAFETSLPRLKELGVDILWIMPIHPIGEKNRKFPEGAKTSLGSYYSVRDYKAVNPEYGTEADFKELVAKAHEMGFKVIIDWVANHTAWDNPWITEHPEWYKQDSTGKILSAFDWTDVAKLNYDNKEMRKAMISSMQYWIDKCDIDGFRCDVAGEVPVDFWEEARAELQKTKPLFMLAENEDKPALYNKAFDASYGWAMSNDLMVKVAKGKDSVRSIIRFQQKIDSTFPKYAFKMNFTSNHDENSWNGTSKEKFGKGESAFAVLTYMLPGMPLIYSGQEAGLNKRLRFFAKDTIVWKYADYSPFYKTLNALKHEHQSLWNPPYGGQFIPIDNTASKKVLSFLRQQGNDKVIALFNLSTDKVSFTLKGDKMDGLFTDGFKKVDVTFNPKGYNFILEPWGYLVLVSK